MTPLSNVSEIVQELAAGAVIRTKQDGHDPREYFLDRGSPRLLDTTVLNMIRDGWLASFNGGYALTDAGKRAYLRSTDEMGDGRLVAPNDQS